MKQSKRFQLIVSIIILIVIFNFFKVFLIEKVDVKPLLNSCGKFPEGKDITIDNLIWQVYEHPKGFIKLLNAYMDMRQNLSIVRINTHSFSSLNTTTDSVYCQFWFDDSSSPYVSKATEYLLVWGKVFEILLVNCFK